MGNQYNWYNLEPKFKNWLIAGIEKTQNNAKKPKRKTTQKKVLTPISVKNYLSDLRHFLGWLIFKFKVQSSRLRRGFDEQAKFKVEEDLGIWLSLITTDLLEEYKSYLVENKIPVKTINRRLSTLRKFFSFCIDQGWIKENPAKYVSNISLIRAIGQEEVLNHFQQDLSKENLDQKTIKSYLDDVREFLNL